MFKDANTKMAPIVKKNLAMKCHYLIPILLFSITKS